MKPDRHYYDDLGGAYYFLPRDVVQGRPTCLEQIAIFVVRIVVIVALIIIFF